MIPDEFEASLLLCYFKEINYFKIKTVTGVYIYCFISGNLACLKKCHSSVHLAFGKKADSTVETRLF